MTCFSWFMRNCEHSGLCLNRIHRMCLSELFCCHFSILKSGYAVPVALFVYVLCSNYLNSGDFFMYDSWKTYVILMFDCCDEVSDVSVMK